MTRGFVTIATGHKQYFELARNLLYSYHLFASQKYPFAIICDTENEFTAEFDDVILLKNARCNYLDKLQLYEYLPYDETIFIDADSLAYGDLNDWWNIFEKADDFSVFGYAWTNLESGRGWFVPEGMKEYKDRLFYIPDFNGGVYYIRRGEICKKIFRLANYFAEHYHEYQFNGFKKAADEPVLALAMTIEQCKPMDIHEKGLAFAPTKKNAELDISIPRAYYHRTKTDGYNVNLVHWSNYKTKQALYKYEVGKLYNMCNLCNGIAGLLCNTKIIYYILKPWDIIIFGQRCFRIIKKILKKYTSL